MRRKQIVLATASISEIMDREKIDAVALAAESVSGCVLLNVAPNEDLGRTLITLAGDANSIASSMYNLTAKAIEILNIPKKSPRIGVVDTVFFVPIQEVTVEECKQLSKRYAKRIYQEFNIPFFYHNYKNYTLFHEFLNLLMERGLKGLNERIAGGIVKPTLGGLPLPEGKGVLFTFARKPSIRFLVNITTHDPDVSFRISQRLDSGSHAKLWSAETKVQGGGENFFIIPEKFKGVSALGAANNYLKNQQINILIYNLEKVTLHELFESIKYEIDNFGAEIISTEFVGLLPKEPLIKSGLFYADKDMDEKELIDLAADKMMFTESDVFVPEVKIIEYLVEGKW